MSRLKRPKKAIRACRQFPFSNDVSGETAKMDCKNMPPKHFLVSFLVKMLKKSYQFAMDASGRIDFRLFFDFFQKVETMLFSRSIHQKSPSNKFTTQKSPPNCHVGLYVGLVTSRGQMQNCKKIRKNRPNDFFRDVSAKTSKMDLGLTKPREWNKSKNAYMAFGQT